MTKTVGIVTEEERNEIEGLYEKKCALENLMKIVDVNENEPLYNKIVSDYGVTIKQFDRWWEVTSQKYQWKGGNWGINFDSREISMDIGAEAD